MSEIREELQGQREAIVDKLEDAALDVLANRGDEGAALVAAVMRQAAEIARWAPYDPAATETEDA